MNILYKLVVIVVSLLLIFWILLFIEPDKRIAASIPLVLFGLLQYFDGMARRIK